MPRKAISLVLLALLVLVIFTFSSHIHPVKAIGPIYIRADGSIDPPTAPIRRDGDAYTLTGNITDDADGIIVERNDTVVDGAGYTLQGTGSGNGINLTDTSNDTVRNMIITGFRLGITSSLEGSSSNNNISANTITNNIAGIYLRHSSNNSINGNIIADNRGDGIMLQFSSNNSISGNMVTNTRSGGIWLWSSSNSSINRNSMTRNEFGLMLDYSSNISISENTFVDDGLYVQFFQGSYSNTVESNTVNGRPLVYLEEVADLSVDDAGQVVLVKCDRIKVENLNLSRTCTGVILWGTSNSVVSGNTITDNNFDGIKLDDSSNNSASENIIANNSYFGIELSDSSNNSVSENIIANNSYGIDVGGNNNSISRNTMTNNGDIAIWLRASSKNTFCHNNLINGTVKMDGTTTEYPNFWDNGCEGNYWSNYNGTDFDNDGVGDAYLPWEGVDNYPLMNAYWSPCDINHDLKVDIRDLVKIAKAFNTVSGDIRWNPHADITGTEPLVADGKVDIQDISLVAKHFKEQYS